MSKRMLTVSSVVALVFAIMNFKLVLIGIGMTLESKHVGRDALIVLGITVLALGVGRLMAASKRRYQEAERVAEYRKNRFRTVSNSDTADSPSVPFLIW